MRLSVIIIVKDEEKMLSRCLSTVKWADEVLIIDTGSTDQTTQIAKKGGARVVQYTKGKHFSDWRNKGLKEAMGEWILYVDADERIPKKLKDEILGIVDHGNGSAYAIPRRNFVLGKELKHGGFSPDYQKRLFKKSKFKTWRGEIHEEPIFKGKLGHLKNPMIHDKHETFSEMVDKTNTWSEIEARLMHRDNHPPMNMFRFITAVAREFWYRMIKNAAFLDGRVGVVFAVYQVFSKFVSYAKLWEMQVKNESSSI